ncbi:hypothetical protein ASPZODRAFT_1947697 [Penicilliopsis zonata CBS 506.65]|uniref:Mid2 domain-containing protein n=1 Tax=Penicilliopsis zonata CBS 506.65 TaxID=1073090 RepID=A0A1L9SJT6_9EURO|nr:hypothetical protein ASPZODRAFT_1947697 [Penicilliopsis zonata CBS 506.65]OJJ47381.1 hypothetical protein ASPZODRAFT_1947697 [Penicilliopsis zonata CBS 506.65]
MYLVTLLLLASTSSATCYYPNGDTDASYRQCPDSLACCLEGESCLSNGLCFTGNFGILYRGLCADTTWPIADCPRACYTEISDGWANLFQCNDSTTLLTCSHEIETQSACKAANALGTYTYTSANVTAGQVGIFTNYSSASSTASSSSSSTSPSSSISSSSSTTSSSPSASNSTCPTRSQSEMIALGAGLGAGLGVPLLLSTALLIYCGGLRRGTKPPQQVSDKVEVVSGQPAESVVHSYGPKELMAPYKNQWELPGS